MIVAFTGHRFYVDRPKIAIQCWLRRKLIELNPEYAISGMALGVDIWAAECCVQLDIPFVAAIPFEGQDAKWRQEDRQLYREFRDKSSREVVCCEPGYAPDKFQTRNVYMVDNCDVLLAVWDGSGGGTANCVKYAHKVGRPIQRLDRW